MYSTAGDPTYMEGGFGLTTVGTGSRTSHSAGQHFTTDVGNTMIIMVGFGFPMMCGDLRGLNGDTAMITSAGRRCLQQRTSVFQSAFHLMSAGMHLCITGILSHAEVSLL